MQAVSDAPLPPEPDYLNTIRLELSSELVESLRIVGNRTQEYSDRRIVEGAINYTIRQLEAGAVRKGDVCDP